MKIIDFNSMISRRYISIDDRLTRLEKKRQMFCHEEYTQISLDFLPKLADKG